MNHPTTSGNKPSGFRYRWNLYRDDTLMYTAIPSLNGVRLIGLPQPMKNTKEILELSYAQYEAHKRKYKLEEATL